MEFIISQKTEMANGFTISGSNPDLPTQGITLYGLTTEAASSIKIGDTVSVSITSPKKEG
jgi:hypothetical protein